MKAAVYEAFGQPINIQNVADPSPTPEGVVVNVEANGICRSDWHGWMGHDPDITLPHVPGHELAGRIVARGKNVRRWNDGDRVTVPFVSGCGRCPLCLNGDQQICDHQFQPGFTHWGAFAQFVAIDYADTNLVGLPPQFDSVTAAVLGCRFTTSFRAVVDQGRVRPGQWVAVHGCGGVGLSALMIAHAMGAQTIGIDIDDKKTAYAKSIGADIALNASTLTDVAGAIRDISKGGAHVSIDALGSQTTCFNSIACLRKRGRHIQVGLMVADYSQPKVPMNRVIADELEILGSHGMQAHRYTDMLAMIAAGQLNPGKLIDRRVTLEEALPVLETMDRFEGLGVTVIDTF